MTSPIERLPVEVFDIIAFDLDLPAYNAIRLVSRQLHSLSFSTYAKKYLAELTTTLGSASLDRLVAVASHQHLANLVTVLDIRLLNHRDYKLLTKITRVGIFPPPKRFPRVSSVRQEHISEEATLYDDVTRSEYPKCIIERLARALKGFGNLQTIRFRAHHSEPYGWRSTTMPEGDQLFRSKCFRAVIDAIVISEVNLKEFSMAKGKRLTTLSKCANLPYPALHFPFPFLQTLQHRFSALESLTLSVMTAYNGDARIPGWENGLGNLIAAAPSVKTLALSLDRNNRVSHYSAAVIRSLSLACRVAALSTFQLVNCSLHEEDLTRFVAAHSESLNQLVFSDIRLLTGSWSSLWTSLKEVRSIQGLRLASLEGTRSPVLFRRRDKERLKITLDTKKAGRPMAAMLDDLIDACIMGTNLHIDGLDAD
ncbi:Nn.00g025790.m01.CDS01 [Neocucurbitaria sp. VM-36]